MNHAHIKLQFFLENTNKPSKNNKTFFYGLMVIHSHKL